MVKDLNQILATDFGFKSVEDMLEEAALDSVVPGICKKCHYTTDVEPDQDSGWCENCEENTVQSCLIVAGLM